MKGRRWRWLLGLLMAISLVTAGCAGRKGSLAPEKEFTTLTLETAPAELMQYYAETKAVPGFFVLHKEEQTYLLVMAGAAKAPAMVVEVADVRKAGSHWRVLARLANGAVGQEFPHAVVQLQAPEDTAFMLRLISPEGDVQELQAMVITDR